MTKEKENELVMQALKSPDVHRTVNQTCRHILVERLRDTQMNDRQLRIALENVVNSMEFPVDLDVEISGNIVAINQPRKETPNTIAYVVVMIVGAVLALLSFLVLRWIGVILMLGSGVLFYVKSRKTESGNPQPIVNRKANLKVKSTTSDIMDKIDSCFNSMKPMFGFNQLDGRYQHVLEWLQDFHSRLAPEKRADVEVLLEDLGYELVAFDNSLGDFFEFHKANVSQRVTSKFAVRNMVTGKFILKGTVVFPHEN